jgi:tetratricopeptide (TPR) repeat protein
MKTVVTLTLAVLFSFPTGGVIAKPRLLVLPQTRDTWRSVRTNNLFVIGNADAEKLRQVAAWLEFFHTAFARLVSRNVLESSVPTTVIIFRDDASFMPFKPLYQGRPANISGYFQPGDDVNYIAISLDPRDKNPYSTAFHEYVHLHVKDNIPSAPVWLNEGLAELYGSLQFSGNDALLGAPLFHYLRLLREQEMLPLKTLFSIGVDSPHYNEQDKSGIFYGQSWALVHYLMLGDRGRQEQFRRFLQQVGRGEDSAKAVEDSFGMSLPALEQELSAYVRRGDLAAQRVASVDNPQTYAAYTAMQRASLTDGEAAFYLGDLLLHMGRVGDAERYFKQAIDLDPRFLPAYAALGRLAIHQRRYDEAKKYLQKATASPQSYMTHYLYAYVLSREGVSPTGHITEYSPENAAEMRTQLLQSIKLQPDYAPAYYLLALVDVVRNERHDEALEMAQKARQLAPSNQHYSDLLEQIQNQRSNSSGTRSNTEAINSATIAEPVANGTSSMLGGGTSGVPIRDGQTIEKSGSLPSVDELLAKYVEATGGAKAINAVTSRVSKGTVDLAGVSRGGAYESYAQAPNKSLIVMQAHPIGTIKLGFNGRNGWASSTQGVRALKGVELATVQRDSDFYGILRTKNNYAKVTLEGLSKIGFRDVYVVDFQPAVGAVERVYLDSQTYLPVRMNTARTNGAVTEPVEVYFDDWREVDGVKYPFSISQRFPKLTISVNLTEIRHNVPIDAKLFEP